jgi:hypothetical protein
VLRCRGHERPKGHEQFVHGLYIRRLRDRFDLNAKLPLRGVRVEVARGSPATGADVREESEREDVCEGVGEREDVAADRYWRDLLLLLSMMLMMVELVDVKDDLVRSLRRNRWNDEMAIIEEGKNSSNRLCGPDQGLLIVFTKKKKVLGVEGLVPYSHE